jgi:hypothetical protein
MANRTIALSIGDIHSNCRFGLMNPEVVLPPMDDMGEAWTPEATESQLWLWDCYTKHIDKIKNLAGKDEIIPLVGGDITHGDKYADKEKVSVRRYDEFHIAADALSKLAELKNVSRMRIVKGTGSHVFGHGTSELLVANMLNSQYGVDAQVAYQYSLNIKGAEFDIAHHGPGPGIRAWLRGNVLRLYVRDIMMTAIMEGEIVPDVILRWHFHQYVPHTEEYRSNGTTYKTMAAISPSYCFIDDYARKASRHAPKLTVGMLAFEIVDGKVINKYEFLDSINLHKREVLK